MKIPAYIVTAYGLNPDVSIVLLNRTEAEFLKRVLQLYDKQVQLEEMEVESWTVEITNGVPTISSDIRVNNRVNQWIGR